MNYFILVVLGLLTTLPYQLSAAPDKTPLATDELRHLLTGNSLAGNGQNNDTTEPSQTRRINPIPTKPNNW